MPNTLLILSNQFLRPTILLLVACCATAQAEQPPGPGVALRKVYVPVDRTSAWPTEGASYLPINSERLDQLLAIANESQSTANELQAVQLVLYGFLAEEGHVSGQGALRVSPQKSANQWLAWPTGGVELSSVSWRDQQTVVRWGYWPEAKGVAIQTPHEGWLLFDWRVDPSSAGEFDLKLPKALATTLVLDLPKQQPVELSPGAGGWLTPPGDGTPNSFVEQAFPDSLPTLDNSNERWMLRCGPEEQLRWRLGLSNSESDEHQVASYLEQIKYRVRESGVTIRQIYQIAEIGELPQRLTLTSPAEVVIRQATWNGLPIPVKLRESSGEYEVILPKDSITAVPRELVVEAWHPSITSSAMPLPQVSLFGLYWTSGTVEVKLDNSLQLADLRLRSTVWAHSSEPVVPSLLRFEKTVRRGRVELGVIPRIATNSLLVSRLLTFRSTGTRAVVDTEWRSTAPDSVRVLTANLTDGWKPRTVGVAAPYVVDDWYVDGQGGTRQLVVRVSRSEATGSSTTAALQLKVEATRTEPATSGWSSLASYKVLSWQRASTTKEYWAATVEDGYHLEINPQPAQLPENEATQLRGNISSLNDNSSIYNWTLMASDSKVFLKPAAAELDATVQTTVVDRSDKWDVVHRIECSPRVGSVEEIRLRGIPAQGESWRWKVEGDQRWRAMKHQPHDDSIQQAGQNSDESVVSLGLGGKLAKPFVVLLEKRTVRTPACKPANIELLDVENQVQWTIVRTPNPRFLQVQATGWHLSAAEVPDSSRVHSVWNATGDSQQKSITISRSSEAGLPLASISEGKLSSIYMPGTDSRHSLTLQVYNQAEQDFTCQLPANASDVYWQQAGETELSETPAALGAGNQLTLPLVSTRTSSFFTIQFTLPSQRLSHGSAVTAPWPNFDIPTANTVWEVRTPSEYNTVLSGSRQDTTTWRTRLFGPLSESLANWKNFGRRSRRTLSASTVPIVGDAPPQLRFWHQPTSAAYQCLALVLATLLGYWLGRTPAQALPVVAIAAIASLLLPSGWCGWATAALGGLLLGLTIRSLSVATRVARLAWKGRSRQIVAAASSSVLLVSTLGVAQALAQDSDRPLPPALVVQKVLIPVDSQGRPSGDQQYITPELLAELLRREQARDNQGAWVAWSPTYTGHIAAARNAPSITASAQPWVCEFDLEVFRVPSVVALPFHREDAQWTGEVLLDGAPTTQTWSPDGERMKFVAPRSGLYKVRIEFQPRVVQQPSNRQVDLHVPPLPDGQLTLHTMGIAAQPIINGRFAPVPNAATETISVSIPTGNRLRIQWSSDATGSTQPSHFAEQQEWLSVSPEQIAIDAIYRIEGSGELTTPELLINQQPAVLKSEAGAKPLEWHLKTPLETTTDSLGNQLVKFQLVANRSFSLGRFRIPELELSSVAVAARQMATGSSDGLSVTLTGAATLDQAAVDQLVQYWPDRENLTQAVDLARATGPPAIAVRRASEEIPTEESLDVCCLDDRLHISYTGEFGATRDPQTVKFISVSPELHVDSVRIVADNAITDAAFHRASPDRLLVLLPEPRYAPYRLKIVGSIPVERNAAGDAAAGQIPRMTASSDSSASQRISLYTSDHLLAELVQGEVEPQLTETMNAPQFAWKAYGVGTFLTTPDRTTPLVVLVSENTQRFSTSMLTTMIRRDNAWIAEIDILLDVAEGKLPELELHWPDAMAGEIDVASSNGIDIETDLSSQRLRLRFGQAVAAGGLLRLTLRSAVGPKSPNQVECPIIDVVGAEEIERYFGQLEDDAGAWTWQHVKPSIAPASIEGLLAAWPSATLLKARSDRPAGEWTATANDKRTYNLPLANISAGIETVRGGIVRTQLVVPAWGIDSFSLVIPAGQQLLQASIDGQAAIVCQKPLGQLQLQMPDPELPHLVSLITQVESPAQVQNLDIPKLFIGTLECEVEQRVYTIEYPTDKWTLRRPDSEDMASVDVAALRLNQLLVGSTSSLSVAEISAANSWARSWIAAFDQAENELRAAIAAAPAAASDMVTGIETPDEYENLLARAVAEKIRIKNAVNLQLIDQEDVGGQPAIGVQHVALTDKVFVQPSGEPLRLIVDSATESDTAVRWALALGIALLASLRMAGRNDLSLPPLGYELLFPVVITIGLLWWLLLWPHIAGLLLALAAIVAWLRWNRIRRLL